MFRNVGQGYLITRYQYSNFELTFELPYIQREEETDAEGKVILPKNDSFGVSFGGDTGGEDSNVNYSGATDLLLFMGNGVMGWNTKHPLTNAVKHMYGEAGCKRTPTIKVTVKDAVVTVSVKWKDEDDSAYETMMSYELSGTPTGYVGIWAPSGRSSTFAIDNISIKNLDINANYVEAGYKGSKFVIPVDYPYEPQEKIYREEEQKAEEKDRWYLPLIGVAGACAVAVGITAGITAIRKKQSRKGGAENEKTI